MGVASDSFQDTHAKVDIPISINGTYAIALVDTGSTLNHISDQLRRQLNLEFHESNCSVCLGVKGCSSKSLGLFKANIEVKGSFSIYCAKRFSIRSYSLVKTLWTCIKVFIFTLAAQSQLYILVLCDLSIQLLR